MLFAEEYQIQKKTPITLPVLALSNKYTKNRFMKNSTHLISKRPTEEFLTWTVSVEI